MSIDQSEPDELAATRAEAIRVARARDRGGVWSRALSSDVVLYPASFGLAIVAWYLAIWLFDLPAYLLPTPHDVLSAGLENAPLLFEHSWITTLEIAAAFALSVVVGLPLGIAIASFRVVDKLINPLLVLSQGVPKIALAPVLLAWFGFGFRANLAIGFLIAVFPIVVNTTLGIRDIDASLPVLARSLSASRSRLFWFIRLPSALPSMMAGMKISVTFAAVGAIIGEFVAGSSGLGYLIQVTIGNLNMALGFAAIVATAVVGLVTYLVVEGAESFLLRHRPHR